MRKLFLAFGLFTFFMATSAQATQAALLTFSYGGQVYWNVLGLDSSTIEVKKIADRLATGPGTSVSLFNDNGRTLLSYDGGSEVDITGYQEDIIEIEEKDTSSTLFIRATENGFAIAQKGVTVNTSFPIKVNSQKNRLSVETATGERFLGILPYEAVNQIIRTNMVSRVTSGELVEKEEGEVVYLVSGERQVVLFKILVFDVPVKVEVSAVTGSVINVDQPLWYSMVDFLLV